MDGAGKIHLYFGYGKGKTTAAIGLCVRAAGAGLRVLVYQCLKGNDSNERKVLSQIPGITCIPGLEREKFIWELTEEERQEKAQFYKEKLEQIKGMEKDYDVIFLDELLDTVSYGLLDEGTLTGFMDDKEDGVELIITGHEKHKEVIKHADYVTLMAKVKHPYDKGCGSREGIEH